MQTSMNVLPQVDRPPIDMRPAGVRPEFYMDAILDEAASRVAGRPIYHDIEFVKIIVPGVVTNIHVKRVGALEKARWPREYEAFRAGQDQPLEGTPLEEWPILTRAQGKELKHFEIRTVEELANLSDVALQNIGMGGRALRDQARAFLSDAERLKLTTRLTHDNEMLQNRVAVLEHQVNELGALLTRVDAERRVLADRPHPLAAVLPAQLDPLANLPAPVIEPKSSLDAFAARRRRRAGPESVDGEEVPAAQLPAEGLLPPDQAA